MPAKEQSKPPTNSDTAPRCSSDVIRGQLLLALGRPADLYRVEVRPLWEDHYRVNVFVGDGATSTKVAQSFFLVTDAGGNIMTSTPAITRQY
jgi:hypothetical protein